MFDAIQDIMSLFRHFDMDGNGSLDFEEFLQGLRVSCCTSLDLLNCRSHLVCM
ncbi:hypothetical protein EON64_21030 [archaeon]|nr:MAG: hypothetical protein EON64_21030 [archaeon]